MSQKTPDTTPTPNYSDQSIALYQTLAQQFIAQPRHQNNMRPLARKVRRALHTLRLECRRSSSVNITDRDSGYREWLNDNFHLIMREGANLLHGLRFADKQPGDGKMPATCALLLELVHKIGVPDAAEFDRLIEVVQLVRPLTVFELEQLPLCLRAALVLTAADACNNKDDEAERLISLSVEGLRRAVGLDFAELTERHSIVERILRNDPAGVYPRMDQKSRAVYRRRIALAALQSGHSEAATADALVEQTKKKESLRERHVGTPLMAFKDKSSLRLRGRVLLILTLFIPAVWSVALAFLIKAPLSAFILYLPLIELFRPILQQIILQGVSPRRLPRIELNGVIPEEGRTVIAVSTLLPGAQSASKTAEKLYGLYNTNGQGAVQICLLADLPQADYPTLPRDAADIAAMRREIRRLNARTNGCFLLAVRPRVFSPTMNAYTGHERKRGAIAELIRVIRGGPQRYLAFEGDINRLRRSRFVLALDSDTGMLLDSAADLVGTALHPLVQAQMSDDKRSVNCGFGILVPRLGAELHSANRTAFSRAMAGVGGVTPYDTMVGDLYMDLFTSAIFTGKGLIDTAVFDVIDNAELPSEQVLSHDIMEGCLLHTGMVSDVEMTDGYPASMSSWLDRLHRWVRGDWQNMPFAFGRKLILSRLDRWKLIDNLRRSITPAASLALIILSLAYSGATGIVLALTGLIAPISGNLLSAFLSLAHGGWITLGGKYYSRMLPRALSSLTQAWFTVIMLPATALTALSAATRAVARLITRRHMLEWTTAAQAEKHRSGFAASVARFWPTLIISALLIYFGTDFARLSGIIFSLLIPYSIYSGRPSTPSHITAALSSGQREQIETYALAMWRYYEEQCTSDENYLPPDNVQESPVWRVAHRTSPTNIGLYLLCIAAAHDFGLLDDDGMLTRIERTLSTIEKLEKWKGNLLNWYDTRTLRPLNPRYVSSVDSGNLVCCYVVLRQALAEMGGTRACTAATRVQKLQQAVDLTPIYNRNRSLFHIGINPDTGKLSTSYYDLLMSESRMTGYYSIAQRIIPKKHWGTLARTLTKSGNSIGPVSWSGTMFEYFMPRLFLPSEEGTMSYEAMRFCLYCQRRRPPRGVPWGISESGFYAFDSSLNYQYKAHGVPRLALKRGLGSELVVSPYSSFLTLTTDPDASLRNLAKLERLGLTGSWGFYEAADFTLGRTTRGKYSVVRSYMAHHIGMSLISCANAVMNDIFVRRFLRDNDMSRAIELCFEKAPTAGTVYEPIRENNIPEPPGRTRPVTEEIRNINPRMPRMHLLSGAEWQLAITDTGAGISISHGLDIHCYSDDLLCAPQGIFAVIDGGEGAFSITAAPAYSQFEQAVSVDTEEKDKRMAVTKNRRAEFETGAAIFTAQHGRIEAGMRAMVHPRLSCEQRQIVLKSHSNHKINATVLLYFEPSLAHRESALSHPAFSRIFLSAYKDDAVKALFISRRQRLGEPPACLAVGLLDGRDFEHEPSREALLERPLGISSILNATNKPFTSSGQGIPDCAVAVRVQIELPPHAQRSVTLVLTAAPTKAAAANKLIEVRRQGMLSSSRSASSPFGGVEAELATQILPDLFYPPRISREWVAAARNNTVGQRALWALGISGDFPLVLVEIHNAADASRAEPYMRLHHSLRLGGVVTELAVAYREGGEYNTPIVAALREAAKNAECVDMLGKRGGIHLINVITHKEQSLELLSAVCVHNGARDLKRTGIPPADYTAAKITKALPLIRHEQTNKLEIPGGAFIDDKFVITGNPRLPWCHVLANDTFGTLVSDKALGFTWAVNSRENKLTPWTNDTSSDNRGEMLLLRADGTIYDTVWGSIAEYGDGFARYSGRCGRLNTNVTVRIPSEGLWKTVELSIENTSDHPADVQAAYYIEPILGVNRRNSRYTVAQWESGALLLRNPFATVNGFVVLTATGGADSCDCDRGNFLSGRWSGSTLSPLPDPCAVVLIRRNLVPGQRESVTFVLGFVPETEYLNPESAVKALTEKVNTTPSLSMHFPRISTPDRLLDAMVSRWIPWQAIVCRMHARTGFYQNGGAWGFRDQLQDSLAALWINPRLTEEQLIRCAGVQFEEGDVLHWWYNLPGMFQGVRTRCSDDLVWLAYVTAEYVDFTNDKKVLDRQSGWLMGEPLGPNENERYFKPERTQHTCSLYEHCIRALEKACTHGEHRLPLIGSGDWNDGFNLIGAQGRGESVWMAMFLAITLDSFATLCEYKGEPERAAQYRKTAADYREAAEACFVKDRYLRAFFDDGTPLGGPDSGDGEIDSLTQSFSVLCGLSPEKTTTAINTVLNKLVDRENGVIKLLAPPFAHSHSVHPEDRSHPVGYISAYPPGLRENGGQYTHAAMWLTIALLKSGRTDEGMELLRIISTAHKYGNNLGDKYMGEPYALAGDVYSHPECPGRAGWTQYTGSAGWFYTAVLRHLLGLRPRGDRLYLNPRLPSDWQGCEISLILNDTPLEISIKRNNSSLLVNGVPASFVPLNRIPNKVQVTVP